VIKALGKSLRLEEPLAGPNERDVPERGQGHLFEAATGDLKGAYHAWGYRRAVEADFTYTCGSDAPAEGHVRTWEGTGTGFLPCSSGPPDPARAFVVDNLGRGGSKDCVLDAATEWLSAQPGCP
jgi:hypothetical protein